MGCLSASYTHAELMRETVHLCLELDDPIVVGIVQRTDEIAYLLHLHPQVGAQHDQIVKTVAHHAPIRGKHRVATFLIKL